MKLGRVFFVLAVISIVVALVAIAPKVLDAQAKDQVNTQVVRTALNHINKIDSKVNESPNYRATTTHNGNQYTITHSQSKSLQTRTKDGQLTLTNPEGKLTYIPSELALTFEPTPTPNIAAKNINRVINAFKSASKPKVTQKITEQYQIYILKTKKTRYIIRISKNGDASTWIETNPKEGIPETSAKTDIQFLERSVNISLDGFPNYKIHTPDALRNLITKHYKPALDFIASPDIPYDSQVVVLDQCIRDDNRYGFLLAHPFKAKLDLASEEGWSITYKIPASTPTEEESPTTPTFYLTYVEANTIPLTDSVEFKITPTETSARPITQNHPTEDIPRRSQAMRNSTQLLYLFTEAKNLAQPHRDQLFNPEPIPDQLPSATETTTLQDLNLR